MKLPESFSGEHRLYTLSEVAEIMNANRLTIYRLVHEGQIPHIRVGEQYRITKGTLDKWMSGALDHLQTPRRYQHHQYKK